MDPLSNLPAWHRDLSADDLAIWQEWADMVGMYSGEWTEAYFAAQNVCGPATRRHLRWVRQSRAQRSGHGMRILVNVYDRRPGVPSDSGYPVDDTCEVYGWRAALAAVRALRDEYGIEGRYDRHTIGVFDARLYAAIDLALYGE